MKKTEGRVTTLYFNEYYEVEDTAPEAYAYLLWTKTSTGKTGETDEPRMMVLPPAAEQPASQAAADAPPPVVTRYYYVNGMRVAQSRNGVWTWMHSDHLHSATVITNASGQETRRLAYTAFGEEAVNSGSGEKPPYMYTGKELGSTGLYYYGTRYYDPVLCRFITPDTVYDAGTQGLNRYSYALNNPIVHRDPTGHTVKSVLGLISQYGEDIVSVAATHNLDPVVLAEVVFAENRNDYNWIKGHDWSSFPKDVLNLPGGPEIKNFLAPIKNNPSLGITEVTLAIAAMLDHPELVPANYKELSREEREKIHAKIAKGVSSDERKSIYNKQKDPQKALQYGAKYLNFLKSFRDYENDYALWLSDYNRGLSAYTTTSEYGRRIDVYRQEILQSLYLWKFSQIEDLPQDRSFKEPEILEFSCREENGCERNCVTWIDPNYTLPPGIDYCPECDLKE